MTQSTIASRMGAGDENIVLIRFYRRKFTLAILVKVDERLSKLEALLSYKKLLRKYRWLKIKLFFSCGKKRDKYKEKRKQIKEKIRNYRAILRS